MMGQESPSSVQEDNVKVHRGIFGALQRRPSHSQLEGSGGSRHSRLPEGILDGAANQTFQSLALKWICILLNPVDLEGGGRIGSQCPNLQQGGLSRPRPLLLQAEKTELRKAFLRKREQDIMGKIAGCRAKVPVVEFPFCSSLTVDTLGKSFNSFGLQFFSSVKW